MAHPTMHRVRTANPSILEREQEQPDCLLVPTLPNIANALSNLQTQLAEALAVSDNLVDGLIGSVVHSPGEPTTPCQPAALPTLADRCEMLFAAAQHIRSNLERLTAATL